MMDAPELSVIIVNYNGGPLLGACLERLAAAIPPGSEILIVDNASADGSADDLEARFPGLRVIRNARNVGYGTANNQALEVVRGRFVLLLNPDVIVEPDAVATGIRYMDEHPDVGILGARILLPNGQLDPPARRSFKTPSTYLFKALGLSRAFPRHRRFGRYYLSYLSEDELADVDAGVGAFMLMPRRLIEEIGGFDERFFLYCEDEDLCWRARQAGWRTVYHPGVVVHHRKGSSTRRRPLWAAYQWHRSLLLYHRKNIAPRYPAVVNAAVYSGIVAGLAASLGKTTLRQAVGWLRALHPVGGPGEPAGRP